MVFNILFNSYIMSPPSVLSTFDWALFEEETPQMECCSYSNTCNGKGRMFELSSMNPKPPLPTH